MDNSQLTREQLLARLAELEAALPTKQSMNGITYKPGPKGGLCAYGLGRYPVTLYSSQWERLVADAKAGEIDRALEEHRDKLAVKPVKD